MALNFLFFDDLTGLWSVDESTGLATKLTSLTQADGGLSKGMALAGGKVYFAAHKPGSGSIADTVLYATDGTAAGTAAVQSLPDRGTAGSDLAGIYGIVSLSNGKAAISYYDGTASSLYISGGAAGTFKAAGYDGTSVPFNSPHQAATLSGISPFPDSFWFLGDGFVWNFSVGGVSASKAGTFNVEPGIASAHGKVFFGVAPSGSSSYTQLWTEDTNSTKTLVVTLPDSSGGGGGAAINALTTLASNKVAFTYVNGNFNTQSIYISDGTAAGTVKVTGYAGSAFAGPDQTAELTGALLFMDGSGLWSVNETTNAATLLKPVSGYLSSDMRTANGKAYFDLSTGAPGAAPQLWVTNGTAAGTTLVKQFPNNTPVGAATLPGISGLAALGGGKLAVDYFDGANETIYLTDGTQAGTTSVTGFSSAVNNVLFYNNSQIAELTVACFVQGTRLATPLGERRVEDLSPGDILMTLAGPRPVQWAGHRRVMCEGHPEPHSVWPVRIVMDAFGPGLPCRELWLSPDHAVFADGVLIPVRCLVNGRTILREKRLTVTYWHVELQEHGVIFAEGLPTESFLDAGGRQGFNGGAVVSLHPNFARDAGSAFGARVWEADGCAPLIQRGPVVHGMRAMLLARADRLALPPMAVRG